MTQEHAQAEKIIAVTQEFLEGLPGQLGEIETEWVRMRRSVGDTASFQALAGKLHSLSGAAASLGFEKIAKAASQLQQHLRESEQDHADASGEAYLSAVETGLHTLRQAVYTDEQINLDKLLQKLGLNQIASTSLQEKRAHRLIYMVEDDPLQAKELSEQIGYFGYTVQICSNPSDLENALFENMPTAILMDVSFPDGSMRGYEAISELRAQFPDLPPTIFITVNDKMPFRLHAVRVGGEAYFTKPLDVGGLVDALDRLILHGDSPPFRVLVVDDSRVQANFIAVQLRQAGMLAEIVSNPLEVIDHMISFNPDLILLDMYMPDCTGMELAKVIRQMEQFLSIPIVYLSAETDKEKQLAALGLGGDDFLTKPIDREHLISAVSTRIERYRKLRAMMIEDGLTGLLNHSTTKERLVYEVNRAKRQNLSFAIAMIDIDHFKAVNDTYGHATGDRVLKSLAFMLKQRLRSTDTIGRIGGEEFAVLFPDTDENAAVYVMTELCEGFEKVHHYANDNEFSVTFSCGVAAYPDFGDVDSLGKAADAALYAAKASGRNQVLPASAIGIGGPETSGSKPGLPEYLQRRTSQGADANVSHRIKRAEADLARALAYLSTLNRISQAVMAQQDLAGIVTDVSREVVGLFQAQHVGISLLSEDRQKLEFLGDSQASWQEVPGVANQIRLTDDPGSAQVIGSGESLVVQSASTNPLSKGSHPLLIDHDINTRVIVPLRSRGTTIGTMNIDFESVDREIASTDLELAETIAASIASVIENSRLLYAEQRQREYFEALVGNLPTAVVTIDAEAKILSWNPAAKNLFGYEGEEVLGENIDNLIVPDEFRQEGNKYTNDFLKKGNLIHSVTRRKRKDGSLADVELLAVPVIVDGKHLASMAIYHDVSALQRARREAEAANEAKSAFLATMSHEIRTPLNAIVGMTTLLLDSQLSDEQREFSETIRTSSDALLAIINDILDFSKIEAGKMELEEQAYDLRECVESALDLVAAKANEKGIDLAYMIDPEVPAVIVSDSTRLRQILLNLLSNALKFTDTGEVVVSVSAEKNDTVSNKAYRLTFSVRDTGIGIPPDRKERLFQSFSQLDTSTTRKYGGTGLGLAISKRLCELMGGKMWVESEGIPGKGATFYFTISVNKSTSPMPVFMNVRQPELTGKNVLIVDDNATNRYILVRQVQSWGMTSQDTSNPHQALQWLKEGGEFDLALLDMQMPEMDGVALATEIVKLTADGPGLPIIVLTSLGLREIDAAGVKFAAYLTKPIKPAQLHSKLLEVFGGRPEKTLLRVVEPAIFDTTLAEKSPLRILLAEDMLVNQRVALLLLERIGYRADVAGNGYEVLEALHRQPYDVIIMDVQMPEMDGLEATRLVRAGSWLGAEAEEGFEHQPYIVAVTANAMQGDREICMAAGMDDYLSKPIRMEELTRALQGAVRFLKSRERGASAAPGTPEAEAQPVDGGIDPDAYQKFAASMGADQDLVISILQDYLVETHALLDELEAGVAQGKEAIIQRCAHSVKSSSLLVGALKLADLCQAVEQQAGNGAGPEALKTIRVEFAAVEKTLEVMMALEVG